MKICYGLIVFNKYEQITRLIETLKVNGNEIIIFVDKKSEVLYAQLREKYKGKNDVHFVENRAEIIWGHVSMVDALQRLMHQSLEIDYDYFTVISESCLPLYPDKEIKKFLEKNKGKEFIDVRFDWTKRSRLHLKHKPYTPFMRKHRNLLAIIDVTIDLLFGWAIGKNKQFKSWKVPTTLIWSTTTKECTKYIEETIIKDKIIEKYRDTLCPDEHAVAEIMYKSSFFDKVFKQDFRGSNLLYCDWYTLKAPKTLTIKDYKKIYQQKYPTLYARKFDLNVDKEIIEKIYRNRENPHFTYPLK